MALYEERDGGVVNTDTGEILKRGSRGWRAYEAWLTEQTGATDAGVGTLRPAGGTAPHARVRVRPPLAARRTEARARVRGSMADALMRSRAKVMVDGVLLWADLPHLLFYLLLAQRASVPAGLSIPDVSGAPFLLTDARLRTLLTRIGVRYLNFFNTAAARIAEVSASETPEEVDTSVDSPEDGDPAPEPEPSPIP
jgi:hypothetical protein